MAEYDKHIDKYFKHGHKYNSYYVSRSNWGDKTKAEQYLDKYWLPTDEYESKWKRLQDQIFVTNEWRSEPIFSTEYQMLALRGGCLFLKEDFEELQACFLGVGDKHFFVIENPLAGDFDPEDPEEPPFRMKYPVDITWEEMLGGNYISAMIIEFFNKEFFVFGESSAWGKYSASSGHWPVDIVGFRPAYSSLFRDMLGVSEKERQLILTWLPPVYRDVM